MLLAALQAVLGAAGYLGVLWEWKQAGEHGPPPKTHWFPNKIHIWTGRLMVLLVVVELYLGLVEYQNYVQELVWVRALEGAECQHPPLLTDLGAGSHGMAAAAVDFAAGAGRVAIPRARAGSVPARERSAVAGGGAGRRRGGGGRAHQRRQWQRWRAFGGGCSARRCPAAGGTGSNRSSTSNRSSSTSSGGGHARCSWRR